MMIATTDWRPAPRKTEIPIYAIGDIHGHLKHLSQLHDLLNQLLDEHKQAHVVHLGDYIDRGPDSLDVLLKVHGWKHPKAIHHMLPGNHEQMMLLFMEYPLEFANWWLSNGGLQTMLYFQDVQDVYQNKIPITADIITYWRQLIFDWIAPIRKDIVTLPTAAKIDDYLFVHGGIPEGMSGDDIIKFQWTNDVEPGEKHPLWVREPFLSNHLPRPDNSFVIHGHSPQKDGMPGVFPTRINIDTGSYFTNNVCMLEIIQDKMRFHISNGR